jgi:hypothetical protein
MQNTTRNNPVILVFEGIGMQWQSTRSVSRSGFFAFIENLCKTFPRDNLEL